MTNIWFKLHLTTKYIMNLDRVSVVGGPLSVISTSWHPRSSAHPLNRLRFVELLHSERRPFKSTFKFCTQHKTGVDTISFLYPPLKKKLQLIGF